ncbi:MAG: MG2 domain-containing protein, partial [bacterium]
MNASTGFSLSRVICLLLTLGLCSVLLGRSIFEEVPVGALQIVAIMDENGKPLEHVDVTVEPTFVLAENQPMSRHGETDEHGKLTLRNLPAGYFVITASSRAHSAERKGIEIREGVTAKVDLKLTPNEPSLDLHINQHIFLPSEQPSLTLEGFGPEATVTLNVWSVDFEALVEHGNLANLWYDALRSTDDTVDYESHAINEQAPELHAVTSEQHTIVNRDVEGYYVESIDLDKLPEGTYWVQAKANKKEHGSWLLISGIGLVTKNAGADVTAFVTTLDTGRPVPNATIYRTSKDGPLALGQTGADGLLQVTMPEDSERAGLYAVSGDSRAGVGLWTSSWGATVGSTQMLIYTDRPVYRPGHTIQFKGVARKMTRADYELPDSTEAGIEFYDPDGNLVSEQTVPVSATGTFWGSLQLADEAATGSYYITARVGNDSTDHYIDVAAYRKPEYAIKVTPLKPFYVRGQIAEMQVAVEYYFGGPVPGATVEAWIERSPAWRSYWEESDEDYYEGWSGEYVDTVTVTTDERGIAIVRFPTSTTDEGEEDWWWSPHEDYYQVRASVSDEGGKYYEGAGKVLVTRGAFDLRADTDRYVVRKGQDLGIKVTATSHLDKTPLVGQKVEIRYGYEKWDDKGELIYDWVGKSTATTGPDGTASITVQPPRNGDLIIKAESEDTRGRTIESRTYTWVADETWADFDTDRFGTLNIQLDKKQYAVGDTADVLITTREPGVKALLTVEGERVYHAEVIDLTTSTTLFQLPIVPEYAPNASVVVTIVKDKELFTAQRRVGVDLSFRKLNIAIASDQTDYRPGSTATYTITTTNSAGQPVAAEVSLGVVDESIYAIHEDSTDPLGTFYPRRWNSVTTNYSFEPVYLDGGDKTASNVEIRTKFLDTAAWIPAIDTGPSGQATVQVPLPDNLTQWRA